MNDAATLSLLMTALVKKFPEYFQVGMCTNLRQPPAEAITPQQHALWTQDIVRRTKESVDAIIDLCAVVYKLDQPILFEQLQFISRCALTLIDFMYKHEHSPPELSWYMRYIILF